MTDETLKKLQDVEKQMLFDIVDICERNNICYYLGCGTLLGAVRHKGFIPWDDDIDILMPWDDYNKFLAIAQKELGIDYFVQDNNTDSNWYRAYARVRKNNTTMMYAHQRKYYVHQGIWVDIFPLAKIRSKFEFRLKRKVLILCNYLIMDGYIQANIDEFEQKLGKIGIKGLFLVYRIPKNIRYKIRQCMIEYVMNSGMNKNKYISEVWGNITNAFPVECFEGKSNIVEFCGRDMNAPANFDLYLRTEYGNNYMTPIKMERHGNLIIDFEKSYTEYFEVLE